MSGLDDIRRNPAVADFEKEVRRVLEPYQQHHKEGFQQVFRLGRAAMSRIKPDKPGAKQRRETSDDIFRAMVVLTHAYLEDFLRTVAKNQAILFGVRVTERVAGTGICHPTSFKTLAPSFNDC
jgi:hypothetical protein